MARLKEVFCKTCGKAFFRSNGRYNEAKKFGWNQYCSKKCLSQDRTKRQTLLCENCGNAILRSLSAVSVHNFCSHFCSATVSNKNRFDIRDAKMKVCLQCGKQYRKIKGNLKYCSLSCRRVAEGYTNEQLIGIIRENVKRLGRVPARREVMKIVDACVRRFGTWNNAIIAAGFAPNRSDSQRMYKRTNTKASDGHLCDSISEALIDNWLFSHKISHQRNACYPTTNHKADWAIEVNGQKVFIEYFGLAKDSKRYDRDLNRKKELCKESVIPLIEIYPNDLYPKNHLDYKLKFLFRAGGSRTL